MIRSILLVVAIVATGLGLLPAIAQAHRAGSYPSATPPPPVMPSSVTEDGLDDARTRAAQVVADAAPPPAPLSIPDVIAGAFAPLGPGAVAWGQRIARCESSYNANAVNSASNAQGLFQFLPSTWAGTPYAAQSPFDPVANANAAAWLFKTYGPSQWECRA